MNFRFLKKLLVTAAIAATTTAIATVGASACTTIYVGGNLTEEGTPFVARTEDYGSDMNKLWFISEAGQFKQGEHYLGCPDYGEFEWNFTHDSYRFTYFTNDVFNGACPECGEENPTHWSYTEFGTNEKGVSVSATETIYGNSAVSDSKTGVDPFVTKKVDGIVGIEETDIPTIILAEAASAREGVELLARIYDEYGAYAASGIFICDQNEVWYIENCSGHQYVAIRLNDDMIFLEPNIAVIGLVDLDDENVIASDRLIEVAQEAGTFVGDAEANIIDFRASYATTGVGAPRMVDGLNFLNENYNYESADLSADNTRFTISNVKDGAIVPMYTNIEADRVLTKDDVFNYYKLSSIGKTSNQEIEIFQLYKDRPLATGTVGWVGVGNMSNNVFVPYYPLLLEDIYDAYQVSTEVVNKVPVDQGRPDGFCTYTSSRWYGDLFVQYPENWRDSYYFTFEGLGGYILYAEKIDGRPVSDADKQYVLDQLSALQHEFYEEFDAMNPNDTTRVGMDMARRAHALGLELIDYITSPETAVQLTYMNGETQMGSTKFYQPGAELTVAKAPVKAGYFFRGWDTDASADNIVYGAGSALTITEDTVLYAVWEKESTGGSSSGGSGSSASSNYSVVLQTAQNGTVTVSTRSAAKGSTVTVTVKADEGYTLDTLTVSDKNGSSVALTEKNGKYTFTMPASKVTVKATFAEVNAPASTDFADVAAGAYYYDAVQWAAREGITGGTSATTFSPSNTCTRAQAVTFLWRAAGSPAPASTAMPFADVAADAYYHDAVLWAVENGITNGTSATAFSPNATCTRGQIVTFLWRSQKSPAAGAANPFADVAADAYCAGAVAWAVENGVTSGTTATTFSPSADCTRAQIVTFLYRCLAD